MLDYKDIITKRFLFHMSGREIADVLGISKSGVYDFLTAFEKCDKLSYPLPEGITNYGIYELVYGHAPGSNTRNADYEQPDFEWVFHQMTERKNMTLVYLWGRYSKQCQAEGKKHYQYRQFCELYGLWCEENYETIHLQAVIGQKMEVDFAGKTFDLIDSLTGEITTIVVFVAVLPYSQLIFAEGMISTKEPQWIDVNNHALKYFGGVPAIVVCDNCKQAVIANNDWINPELNKDYAEWADHNHTAILPAKVRKPKYKSSVENAVGILEKGLFHDLEELKYFSLDRFNQDLWNKLNILNHENFRNKDYSRYDRWLEERKELMPLPSTYYRYMERKTAKVSSDFHVRFDNAYYSVPKQYIHKQVMIRATATTVKIIDKYGTTLCEWPRASVKGQWLTNPEHLPKNFKGFSEWNSAYFMQKAHAVGPCTAEVIRRILTSRKYEVQTYRQCIGVLNFAKKYSKLTLETCCKQALEFNKTTYTFIKNSIPALAEETMTDADRRRINDEKNKGAYVMGSDASDLNHLLAKSQMLINEAKTGGDEE